MDETPGVYDTRSNTSTLSRPAPVFPFIFVGKTCNQRCFGTDHHQVDVVVDAESGDCRMIVDGDVDTRSHLGDAGIAGRAIELI